jgi:hypothetical protein
MFTAMFTAMFTQSFFITRCSISVPEIYEDGYREERSST